MYTKSIKTGEDMLIKFEGLINRLSSVIDTTEIVKNRNHIQRKLLILKRKDKLNKILKNG